MFPYTDFHTAHESQDEEPPVEVVPVGHKLHTDTPAREYKPEGQGIQPCCPKANVPAGHTEHAVDEP